jgi:hypothetical protein
MLKQVHCFTDEVPNEHRLALARGRADRDVREGKAIEEHEERLQGEGNSRVLEDLQYHTVHEDNSVVEVNAAVYNRAVAGSVKKNVERAKEDGEGVQATIVARQGEEEQRADSIAQQGKRRGAHRRGVRKFRKGSGDRRDACCEVVEAEEGRTGQPAGIGPPQIPFVPAGQRVGAAVCRAAAALGENSSVAADKATLEGAGARS